MKELHSGRRATLNRASRFYFHGSMLNVGFSLEKSPDIYGSNEAHTQATSGRHDPYAKS